MSALDALVPDEHKRLLLSVGTHRGVRPLSPVEVATLLRRVVASGASLAACAEALHLGGTSQIGRFLSLLKLPEDVQHLVDWGRSGVTVAFTAAFEVSRLEDHEDQRLAAHAVLEFDLSTAEVRQLVQARKRSKKPMDECVRIILKMRPQVEVRHVFVGSVREDIRPALRLLTQFQRDKLLHDILEKTFRELHAGGRLGLERFTLVGGKPLGDAAKAKKDEIEMQMNAELAEAAR